MREFGHLRTDTDFCGATVLGICRAYLWRKDAESAYSLRDFAAAESYFNELLSMDQSDIDDTKMLNRVSVRLRETATGQYDLRKVAKDISASTPRVDIADFVSRTEIRDSPRRTDEANSQLPICNLGT